MNHKTEMSHVFYQNNSGNKQAISKIHVFYELEFLVTCRYRMLVFNYDCQVLRMKRNHSIHSQYFRNSCHS